MGDGVSTDKRLKDIALEVARLKDSVKTEIDENTAAINALTTELRYAVKHLEFITGERLLAEDLDDEHRLSIEDLP
jgi:hypothetical protein